jgi:hypothetical protein
MIGLVEVSSLFDPHKSCTGGITKIRWPVQMSYICGIIQY